MHEKTIIIAVIQMAMTKDLGVTLPIQMLDGNTVVKYLGALSQIQVADQNQHQQPDQTQYQEGRHHERNGDQQQLQRLRQHFHQNNAERMQMFWNSAPDNIN